LTSEAAGALCGTADALALVSRTLDAGTRKKARRMELNSFLGGDAALLLFSGLGLVATGIAIVRDIPVQRRIAERPMLAPH
jgi:hypothetical protein